MGSRQDADLQTLSCFIVHVDIICYRDPLSEDSSLWKHFSRQMMVIVFHSRFPLPYPSLSNNSFPWTVSLVFKKILKKGTGFHFVLDLITLFSKQAPYKP